MSRKRTTQDLVEKYKHLEAHLKSLKDFYVLKLIGLYGPANINQDSGVDLLNGGPMIQANGES